MNPTATRIDLQDKIAATATDTLVTSLTALRANAPLDEAGRMIQSMIVDVLTDRMPELLNAVDAWVEDDDSPFDTPADVVLDILTRN